MTCRDAGNSLSRGLRAEAATWLALAVVVAYPYVPGAQTDAFKGVSLFIGNEYGAQIMTPAYERDPEQPKIVPREAWYQAPAKKE